MHKYLFFLTFIFLFSGNSLSQIKDRNLSYKAIENKIDESHTNPSEMWDYINLYINKSKKENNQQTLMYAYRYASNYSKGAKSLKYADSAINIAQKTKNKTLIAEAYTNRGMIYMDKALYKRALDDILISNKYSLEVGDQYAIHKTIYHIAQNKIYLGLYEDANKELLKCVDFFRKKAENNYLGKDYSTYYLFSLSSYIDSNTKIGRQKENGPYLKEAFNYIEKNNLPIYKPYFISSEGTDAYYEKDYKQAISKLSEAIRLYNDQWTHLNEVYYIGMSHWKLGNRFAAIKYFEQLDTEYNKTKKLDPTFRSAYEILIKYNDSLKKRDKQLEYINKLMTLDRSYEKNFKYLYAKINKEYDTKKLIAEKNKIEESLKADKRLLITLLFIAVLIMSVIGFRYNRLERIHKERFEKMIAERNEFQEAKVPDNATTAKHQDATRIENEEKEPVILQVAKPTPSKEADLYNKIPGLNPVFVESILKQLEDFENDEDFLDPQISQKLLSERFGTNSTYLSKIINAYKGKNFNIYINDLRLEFIVDLLKTDWKYLNKDVKELSQIAGFANSENFSDNFQRKYQLKPSYFIKMMKENLKTSAQSHNPALD